MAKKVKPLFRIYEREMTAYALLRGIDYISDECPFSKNAFSLKYKQVLDQIENVLLGSKHSIYTKFLDAKADGLFRKPEDLHPILKPYELCGQPTSASGLCSFCRMVG